MGDSRTIRAGETIRLRALFKDELGEAVEATSVTINIWEPGEDTTDVGQAIIQGGIPTYIGNGIFEYEYIVPDCGPAGTWTDQWNGELTCQSLSVDFNFTVIDTGSIAALECQLYNNDIVEVIVASGILALDGSKLNTAYSFEFLTKITPAYTNVRKVRLAVGGFLGDIDDYTVQTSILESSLEADVMSFTAIKSNTNLFNHARREFVTCLTANTVLGNLMNIMLKSKTLADLSVQYDTNGIRNMLDKLNDCMNKWAPQLMSGGFARGSKQASMVVKGELDPDRPITGRMWESPVNGSFTNNGIPMANTKAVRAGQRRYLNVYWPRTKRWW